MKVRHIRYGDRGLHTIVEHRVFALDASELESHLRLHMHTSDGRRLTAEGLYAVDAVLALCPTLFENLRMRWLRHRWALHNLVGHPLMQLLAFLRMHRLALWIHDVTVPRPSSEPR